mmetsp:Transcript_26925/g.69089  ORF Transcript_26925/g.69089 Transcript_26925/m.69089 type:complete len:372 (+) Transcript_26925:479-1594(+)
MAAVIRRHHVGGVKCRIRRQHTRVQRISVSIMPVHLLQNVLHLVNPLLKVALPDLKALAQILELKGGVHVGRLGAALLHLPNKLDVIIVHLRPHLEVVLQSLHRLLGGPALERLGLSSSTHCRNAARLSGCAVVRWKLAGQAAPEQGPDVAWQRVAQQVRLDSGHHLLQRAHLSHPLLLRALKLLLHLLSPSTLRCQLVQQCLTVRRQPGNFCGQRLCLCRRHSCNCTSSHRRSSSQGSSSRSGGRAGGSCRQHRLYTLPPTVGGLEAGCPGHSGADGLPVATKVVADAVPACRLGACYRELCFFRLQLRHARRAASRQPPAQHLAPPSHLERPNARDSGAQRHACAVCPPAALHAQRGAVLCQEDGVGPA